MAGHAHDLSAFAHEHVFTDAGQASRQRAIGLVTLLTLATMAVELAAGWWSGSLALTADGWHMGTHAFALGGAWVAYHLSRGAGTGYAFGGWKIEVLAAYTSGLGLAVVAVWIAVDAVDRLRHPVEVNYPVALLVACIGLAVNAASAWMLMRGARTPHHHPHHHGHGHPHAHDAHHEHHHHGDHNYRAALMHVLADALTSLLAIVALAGGLAFGWAWLDPAVALFGAVIIARWSFGVLRASAGALVDATADPELAQRIRSAIESDDDARIADLHVWQVGSNAWSTALSVVADRPLAAADYRRRLQPIAALRHVTVEVHRCPGPPNPQ